MDFSGYKSFLLSHFIEYVKIDTQSDEESTTYPSTAKQFDLLRVLEAELRELGLSNVELDQYGYLTATLPSNSSKKVPTVGFIAHVDTSPEISGANVKPIVHENYQGQDIVLPDRPDTVIKFAENPWLAEQVGNDIVTASGTTLLGADDKAGVAAIMTAMRYLLDHPEIKHGDIRVGFTPDEEVGGGTTYFDVKKFNAHCAYTLDGSTRGQLEAETFSADAMSFRFEGFNTHPGFGKGVLINAIKVASHFIELLPKASLSPETTEDRQGFVHPTNFVAGVDSAKVDFILRDFVEEKLEEEKQILLRAAQVAVDAYPGSKFTYEHRQQYRNMSVVLDKYPDVVGYARLAIEEAGLPFRTESVRGGTDGSALSFRGLPTPNIFTGEQNFHSRYEWVSVQDMLKSAEVAVRIAQIWERNSK